LTTSYLAESINILSIAEPKRASVSTKVEKMTTTMFIDLLIRK
jgi:hypothetical protein